MILLHFIQPTPGRGTLGFFPLSVFTGGNANTTIRVLLAVAPVALPTAYLLLLKYQLALRTVVEARVSPPDAFLPLPTLSTKREEDEDEDEDGEVEEEGEGDRKVNGIGDSVAPDVTKNPGGYVVARERVTSHWIAISALKPEFVVKRPVRGRKESEKKTGNEDGSGSESEEEEEEESGSRLEGLLEAYLAATMRAFSWTPQALIMAGMGSSVQDPAGYKRSFARDYLNTCRFMVGDRVCGVYVVRAREAGRVVLDLSPPVGWKGPVVSGVIDTGFERVGEDVRLVNETIMWRRKDEKKPTLLEGRLGRWMHTLMASWLVVRGVKAVLDG
ncbi:uncharacterized protein F4822DRAFT_418901 [Hypoxylon trugodes]|uniref:uncharacterized protein n=1 Tax=Hypoxylon trugodes TaxID=326681 RepID=UPI00218D52C8|nr:uncharacterized protein F4822DRAFT_418901 [Hypoxylon trugodes]KAI1384158.1 hypothetical protein F4822DRAFT_418901 [Hypoxylon trugodes]